MTGKHPLYVPLTREERQALDELAEREMRDARDQARYLIVEGLRQREYLREVTEDGEGGKRVV